MKRTPLPQPAITLLIVMSALLAGLAYWALLLEWVQDYRTGVADPLKAVCQLAAHGLYLYVGVRFLRNRIRFF